MKKLLVLVSALAIAAPVLAEQAHVRSTAPLVVGAVSHVLLPTSAFANGQFGAVFKTKLSIANVTGTQYSIRAGFSTGAGEVSARSITIRPYETLTYQNFLDEVFQTTGAGAIDFDSGNTSNRFIVSAQVYVDGPNGRFSTAVQSADEAGTIINGRPGYVVGVSANSFDRTNVGCASDSGNSQTITVQVYSASNQSLGSLPPITLGPYSWTQVGMNIGVTDGILIISSTQRAVCYGVVVDNVSNDGTFQLAVPD
ncbi:MAG: hypothetical protein ABIT01_10605 [Thermoanaerobaculia bacterium]